MNERIKELALQADPDHCHKRWYSGVSPRVMDPEIKKLVELIVRECINEFHVADVGDLKGKGYYPDKVAEHLEQHFGIEYRKPCKSPYCECDVNKCSHPGFYDARGES